MGFATAAGLAECVSNGAVTLDNAVALHLSHNHYPPLPAQYRKVCLEAIELASQDVWDKRIQTAPGHRDTVAQVVRLFHLEPFINLGPDEVDDTTDNEEEWLT